MDMMKSQAMLYVALIIRELHRNGFILQSLQKSNSAVQDWIFWAKQGSLSHVALQRGLIFVCIMSTISKFGDFVTIYWTVWIFSDLNLIIYGVICSLDLAV